MKYLIILITLIIFYIFLNKINKPENYGAYGDYDKPLAENIYKIQNILKDFNNTNKSINITNTIKNAKDNTTPYYMNNINKDDFDLNMDDFFNTYIKKKKIIIPKNVNLNGLIVFGDSYFKSDIVDNKYFEVNGSDNIYPHYINLENKNINIKSPVINNVKPRLFGGIYGKYIDKMNRGLYFRNNIFEGWEKNVRAKIILPKYSKNDSLTNLKLHKYFKFLIQDDSKNITKSKLEEIFGKKYIDKWREEILIWTRTDTQGPSDQDLLNDDTINNYRLLNQSEINIIQQNIQTGYKMKAEYFKQGIKDIQPPILYSGWDKWLLDSVFRSVQYPGHRIQSFDSCFTEGVEEIDKKAIKLTDYDIVHEGKNKFFEFLKTIPTKYKIKELN